MSLFASDAKFAVRNLSRAKLFTLVAVSSLALGIGANTAIFTLVDQLLLRLLPVHDPDRLVMIWTTGPHIGSNRGTHMASYPMYQDFQQKAQAFSYVFCRRETSLSVNFAGTTERVDGELVSGNYFQGLGVKAALGRVFTPDLDDRVYKGHPVVVLSYPYWVTRFAANPAVIGQKMLVNDYPMTIVGVSAAGFNGVDPARSPQIRVPMQMKPLMTPGWDEIGERRSQWVQMFARLKPGFTLDSAKASLQPLLTQILRQESTMPEMKDVSPYYIKRFLDRKVLMESAGSGFSQMRRNYGSALVVLMCMVGLVLLIACFNVANLLIARAVARQKEIAVRLAIGASRWQLIRQLLIESLLLSIAGGAAGLLLAVGLIRGLLSFLPPGDSPLMLTATPDGRILAFNAALAIFTGILFGLAPAVQSLRVDLWKALKDVIGAVSATGGSVRFRKILVIAQVAFSFLLLAGAGLFARTLINLKQTSPGFRSIDRIITFQVDPALNGYTMPRMEALYSRLLDNIRAVPGVKAASYAVEPVLSADEWDSTMSVEGHVIKDGEDMQAFMNGVSNDYWQTMGIPLLEGRDFNMGDGGLSFDGHTAHKVAIVNRRFATHFFGSQSPLGHHIAFGDKPKKLDIEIVAVTGDTLYEGPREGVHRQVFLPFLHVDYPAGVVFYVRTAMDPGLMYSTLRGKVRELDAALPVFQMKTLERQLDETLSTERLIASLSAGFGVLATLLAAIGLYGVMAFVVARRTREIGLRMALGAPQRQVVWMVLRETFALAVVGLAIGIPSAMLLARYVSTQLYGVKPTDLTAASAAVLVLSLVSAGAGFLPARRASTIDPIQALRYE
ncbi:MAG TPA: ABC transporter permease [Bryobacteraceae bacterium]|nr:ABC transporter permease [Bryobacteraceae bacterium]